MAIVHFRLGSNADVLVCLSQEGSVGWGDGASVGEDNRDACGEEVVAVNHGWRVAFSPGPTKVVSCYY